MSGNLRLYNSSGYVELQAPSNATSQTLILPTDSIQPALVHITTQDFSSAGSISIDNIFTSEYDNYKIIISITNSTAVPYLWGRFRSSGSDNTDSLYRWGATYQVFNGATTITGENSGASTKARFGTVSANSNGAYSELEILSPYLAKNTAYAAIVCTSNDGYSRTLNGRFEGTSQFDGINFYTNADQTVTNGNITGTVRVYGYKNS